MAIEILKSEDGVNLVLYSSCRLTRRVSIVEQELLIPMEHLSARAFPIFSRIFVPNSLTFFLVFCGQLFVVLFSFLWP
jgi:hypothetical protein